jgi:hypothetical protein
MREGERCWCLSDGAKEKANKVGIGSGVKMTGFVVLKLVASCRWNCGLDKLATILEMKTLHKQPAIHAAA